MYSFQFPLLAIEADSTPPPMMVVIGFLVVLGLLLVILLRGKPVRMLDAAVSHPPKPWTRGPAFAEQRRRAAAAACAVHLHTHARK